MKKIFLLIILILFVKIQAQINQRPANLEIPILIYDNSAPPSNSQILTVGLDSTATDGIDAHLGESGLPCAYHFFMETECPPVDMFKAILQLPPFTGNAPISYKDFRFGQLPYTGQKQHRIFYQTHSSATELHIEWAFPPGVSAILSDGIIGTLINVRLIGTGTYSMPPQWINVINRLNLQMIYYNAGGNPAGPFFVISDTILNFPSIPVGHTVNLPVTVSNYGYLDTLIIANAVSSNSYFTVSPDSFPFSIAPLDSKTFNITYTAAVGAQTGIIEFIHNAPGSPHVLSLSAPGSQALDFGMINVASGNYNHALWFGVHPLATDGIDPFLDEHDLPPPPPSGAFDTRLILPQNNFSGSLSSYKDYRFGILPFTGQKEFRIAYQPFESNNVVISWYLPNSTSGVLHDIVNGTLINVPISDTGSFTVTNPIAFSRLKMLIDFDDYTPVEFISFTSEQSGPDIKLNWVTSSETNNLGFEVERKQVFSPQLTTGNEKWEKISFVEGRGTTTEPKSYSFIDEDVTTGTYKYRLKQIDFDGSFNYSREIEVKVDFTPKEFVLYQNYPNPFNPSTKIKYTIPKVETHLPTGRQGRDASLQMVKLKVYDVLGKEVATLVNEEKQPGVYEVGLDGSGLASGVYMYRLTAGDYLASKKLVLMK